MKRSDQFWRSGDVSGLGYISEIYVKLLWPLQPKRLEQASTPFHFSVVDFSFGGRAIFRLPLRSADLAAGTPVRL